MNRIFVILTGLLLIACSTPPTIEPEAERVQLGQQGTTAVTLPLSWHASEHWQIDPLFGAAERSGCGDAEPYLRSLALELDAASVPSGATVYGVSLVIDPCDERGAWLPDNVPSVALFSVDRFGVPIQVASGAQDQSPNVAAYIEPHEIHAPMLPAPVVVNREKNRYLLLFEPEHGLEATGGTRVTGLVVDISLP